MIFKLSTIRKLFNSMEIIKKYFFTLIPWNEKQNEREKVLFFFYIFFLRFLSSEMKEK